MVCRNHGYRVAKVYRYPIQRIDAARVFILFHYGGVYLDMDMACKVPMSVLFKNTPSHRHSVILAKTEPVGVTNNLLVSKKGALFFSYLSRRLVTSNGRYVSPYFTVMFTAGPLFVYRSYLKYPCKELVHRISSHLHSDVYFVHTHASQWHGWDAPVVMWLSRHGRTILQMLAVLGVFICLHICWKHWRSWTFDKPTTPSSVTGPL